MLRAYGRHMQTHAASIKFNVTTGKFYTGQETWYTGDGIHSDNDRLYTVSQKNEPTLASCSFVKHGLILIILGKQHQHIFQKVYAYSTFLIPSLLLTLFAFK